MSRPGAGQLGSLQNPDTVEVLQNGLARVFLNVRADPRRVDAVFLRPHVFVNINRETDLDFHVINDTVYLLIVNTAYWVSGGA